METVRYSGLSHMERETDRRFMAEALALAEKGRGLTSPNPIVGALVVRDGIIAGSGWHQRAGGPHAEVYAIREAGDRARGGTLYVTLEPCCHYGKTPPCTELIIESGIARVVAAMKDDNPLVCGNGCASLEASGVIVDVGVMEAEARRLNEAFLKHIRTGMPFVTLKLASTLDGYIADASGKSKWITGPETRRRVHQWRAWSDAVMVGVGTVLADDPSLTVRDAEGRDPLRVVVDSRLRTPPGAKVLAGGNTIIATTIHADVTAKDRIEHTGAEVWVVEDEGVGRVSLSALMKLLGRRGVTSVFCEGGGVLAGSFLRDSLADKMIFTMAAKLLGDGLRVVAGSGIASLDDAVCLKDIEVETLGGDIIVTGYMDNERG